MKYIYCILFIGIVSCQKPCDREEVKKIMGDYFQRNIKIPDSMQLINKEYIDKADIFDLYSNRSGKYILHYFLADCGKCVEELKEIQSYISENINLYNTTKFVFIATGPNDLYVQEAVEKLRFKYPIYFDKDYQSFKRINNLPLGEKVFNTMLMNSKDQVEVFGGFYDNAKAEKMYMSLINCQD